MVYDKRRAIHATTDPDVRLSYNSDDTVDGKPVPEVLTDNGHRYTDVKGPYAVWLDHSCDEWVIANGSDPTEVAAQVRQFAETLIAKADAIEQSSG